MQNTNKGNNDHMAEPTFVPRRPCKHHMHQCDQYVTPINCHHPRLEGWWLVSCSLWIADKQDHPSPATIQPSRQARPIPPSNGTFPLAYFSSNISIFFSHFEKSFQEYHNRHVFFWLALLAPPGALYLLLFHPAPSYSGTTSIAVFQFSSNGLGDMCKKKGRKKTNKC